MSSSMATKPNSLRTKSWLDIQSRTADQVPVSHPPWADQNTSKTLKHHLHASGRLSHKAWETTGASHDELFWDFLDHSANALQGMADMGQCGWPPGRRAESTPNKGRPGQVPSPFKMRCNVLQITSRAFAALWNGLLTPNMALVLVSSHVHILQKMRYTYASPVSQLATLAPGLEASTVRLTLGLGGPGWGGGASCSEREAFSVA